MPKQSWVAGLLLATGCGGGGFTYGGVEFGEYFPFDGERAWTFVNTDPAVTYKLQAVLDLEATEPFETDSIYTVRYSVLCVTDDPTCVDGEELFSIRWRSTQSSGVFVHGTAVGGVEQEFKPPLQLFPREGKVGDVFEGKGGGVTYATEFVATEVCPVKLNVDWDACIRFQITAEGADGYPLTGDWWAINQYNVVALQLEGESGQWQLSDSDCEGECNGEW